MNKTVEFDLFKINRGRLKLCRCRNPHYEIDTTNRIVSCIDCGAVIDPFDAILRLCENVESYEFAIEMLRNKQKAQAELTEKEMRRRMSVKAIKDLDASVRKGMLPVCPICNEAFDPTNIHRYINKRYAEVQDEKNS